MIGMWCSFRFCSSLFVSDLRVRRAALRERAGDGEHCPRVSSASVPLEELVIRGQALSRKFVEQVYIPNCSRAWKGVPPGNMENTTADPSASPQDDNLGGVGETSCSGVDCSI